MIDPKLLTPENGFVEGVVMEVDTGTRKRTEYFSKERIKLDPYHPDRDCYLSGNSYWFREIISIRPLTGPMAIWNFAPEWAEYATTEDTGVFWWERSKFHKNKTLFPRPFWAKAIK